MKGCACAVVDRQEAQSSSTSATGIGIWFVEQHSLSRILGILQMSDVMLRLEGAAAERKRGGSEMSEIPRGNLGVRRRIRVC